MLIFVPLQSESRVTASVRTRDHQLARRVSGPDYHDGAAPDRPVLLTLHEVTGLRGPDWKVLLDRRSGASIHLDLAADPGERRPSPARRAAPDRLAALEARLAEIDLLARSLAWGDRKPVDLDAGTLARLQHLGYID